MSSEADKPLSALSVFIAGIAWRLFGSRRAGATLLQAMTANDEQNRMLAGMSLVKAGERSMHLIENTIKNEKNKKGSVPSAGESVPLIRLLPDIGGEDARELLQAIASRETGDMAEAATECIDLLDRMNAL